MRSFVVLVIIVLIIVGISFFVFKSKNIKKEVNSKELEITYELNAGIPFKWTVEIEDESIVEYVRSYVVRDDNKKGALTGASVYTNYVFKGLKEGTTSITFKLVNFADNYVSREEVHKVNVDSEGNITLIGG